MRRVLVFLVLMVSVFAVAVSHAARGQKVTQIGITGADTTANTTTFAVSSGNKERIVLDAFTIYADQGASAANVKIEAKSSNSGTSLFRWEDSWGANALKAVSVMPAHFFPTDSSLTVRLIGIGSDSVQAWIVWHIERE